MTEFVIEKNVPMPAKQKRGHFRKYPFAEMAIGQSFELDNLNDYLLARTAGVSFGRVHSKRFSGRRSGDGGRIWRVE